MTRILMVVRSSMMDELNTQHIKVAIAKGLPFRRVVGVHALRNIAIPVMTLAATPLPLELIAWARPVRLSCAGSTVCPIVATTPLIVTRPAPMSSSALRRDATPARDRAR